MAGKIEQDDSRYLTDEQLAAREPWWKRARDTGCAGCSVDLFALILIVSLPTWWPWG